MWLVAGQQIELKYGNKMQWQKFFWEPRKLSTWYFVAGIWKLVWGSFGTHVLESWTWFQDFPMWRLCGKNQIDQGVKWPEIGNSPSQLGFLFTVTSWFCDLFAFFFLSFFFTHGLGFFRSPPLFFLFNFASQTPSQVQEGCNWLTSRKLFVSRFFSRAK